MSQPTGNPFSLADINLALVSIARPTFDLALAEQFTALVRAELTQAGLPPGGPDRMIRGGRRRCRDAGPLSA